MALAIATIAVLAGLVLAFMVLGSPAHQRDLAFDRRRVDLLQSMSNEIRSRYFGTLPTALPDALIRHDPQTRARFIYRRLGPKAYELCATFALPHDDGSPYDAWKHAAGLQCFRATLR